MTTSPAARVRSAHPRTATTVPVEPISGSADEVTSQTNPNAGLNATDQANLAAAIAMERALQALYATVPDIPGIRIIEGAHEAFATRLAGIAGTASTVRDDALFAKHESAFGDDPFLAGVTAESDAATAYLDWVVSATDARIVAAMSAIAVTESRLVSLLGVGELVVDAVAEVVDGATDDPESTTDTTEAAE